MPEPELEPDGYTFYSPSSTRIYKPFLDPTTPFSDETYSEGRNSDHQNGVTFSRPSIIQHDDRSEEAIPATSTPDLSFTASSSPCRFAMRESPALHATSSDHLRCSNLDGAPLFGPTPGHASFSQRLDDLLKKAADQQYQLTTGENMRTQLELLEEVPDSASQMASFAYGEASDLAVSPKVANNCDSRLSDSPQQKLQRSCLLSDGASDDFTHAVVAYEPEADYDSRSTKRKSRTATNEGSNTPPTGLIYEKAPSGSYLSASDEVSPTPSHCPDVLLCSPPKKRRRLSLNVSQLSAISSSRADSSAVSGTQSILSVSLTVRKTRGSDFRYARKGVQCPSPFRSSFRDEPAPALKVVALAHPCSTCDFSYPPTEIATPCPDLSPVPILDVQDFPKANIPRVFWSNDDAAVARLMSLLRREAHFYQSEGLDALVDPDLAFRDALVPEVIAWILKVEPPFGSPTATSIRGRVHSHDLHEQLTVHHDSRFFATLLFSSFSFVQARDSKVSGEVDQQGTREHESQKGPKNMIVWDYAIAAIALAVKMHRDSSPPLKPIFCRHFLALVHHEMYPEDLELAQRKLLKHFSYNLGMPTPQEFLDELLVALPTLRLTLGYERGWQHVVNETWKQLIAAAHRPDMLRFPVSLLTATAISHAIKRVIHRRFSLLRVRYTTEFPACACDCHMELASPGGFPQNTVPEHELTDTELAILGSMNAVLEDIREVLGLSIEKIGDCEEWLAVVREASEKPLRSKYFQGVRT